MSVNFNSLPAFKSTVKLEPKNNDEINPQEMKIVKMNNDPKELCSLSASAKVSPKVVIEGIGTITAVITGITQLIKAGMSLRDAIDTILPHGSKEEKQQLETQLKACMEVDNEPGARLNYAA